MPTADEAFEVRAFSEKPVPAIAARIIEEGALWNCFVVVCRAARLLELARRIRGADVVTLAAAAADPRALATAYQSLRAWNVSSDLLARVTAHLLVVRAHGIGWSDWGTVGAIERTLLAIGRTPPWRTPHVEASVGC